MDIYCRILRFLLAWVQGCHPGIFSAGRLVGQESLLRKRGKAVFPPTRETLQKYFHPSTCCSSSSSSSSYLALSRSFFPPTPPISLRERDLFADRRKKRQTSNGETERERESEGRKLRKRKRGVTQIRRRREVL